MFITDRHTGEVFDLDPHQLEALDWLYTNPRAALFLGMSLQKTVTTLLYLYDMTYNEAAISKTLVIAPDKVARLTWPDEVNKWEEVSDLRYSVISGTAKQRLDALNADADVYFIGVDNLVWLIDMYIIKRTPSAPWSGSLPFDCMVIDELSLFKSQSSGRFKKLRRALGLSNIPYRIGLTGTPSPNGLIDLWAEMFLIDEGERLGQTYGKFVDKYFNTRGNGMIVYEYTPKAGAEKVIAKKIADIALSMQTRDYKDLPDLILDDREIELDPFDREIYDELEREYVLEFLDGEDVTVKTGADLVNKLLQVASGAIYEDRVEGKAREWHEVNTAKIDALAELLEEHPDDNFLLVYQFQHEVERIKKRFPWAVTLPKGKKLKETFDAWNRGEIKLLVIHPASAGHGLNLQFGGRRMVWTCPTWNLEHWLQTLARLLRTGALRTIYVHRLLAKGTRDMQVRKRVNSKDKNQEYLLDQVKQLKKKHYGGTR